MPARSPEFLSFVHLRRPGPCVSCGLRPWEELHHFGDDGGMGLKPSDYLVARLCRECHAVPPFNLKLRALLRASPDPTIRQVRVDLALAYLRDAAASLSAWAAFLEEQNAAHRADGCARDELVEWLADYDGRDPAAAEEWLLAWAARRRENVLAGVVEALQEIARSSALVDARFTAARALRTWGIADGPF